MMFATALRQRAGEDEDPEKAKPSESGYAAWSGSIRPIIRRSALQPLALEFRL